MKYSLLLLTLFVVSIGKAQSLYEKMCLKGDIDSNYIQLIDAKKLKEIITSNTAEIYLVPIITNFCSGTKFVLEAIQKLETEYPERLKIIISNCCPYSEIKDYQLNLRNHHLKTQPVYLIDSKVYKDDPEDDREKGLLFRNAICHECEDIIIGVPFLLLFNQKGELIQKGYPTKFDYKVVIKSLLDKK